MDKRRQESPERRVNAIHPSSSLRSGWGSNGRSPGSSGCVTRRIRTSGSVDRTGRWDFSGGPRNVVFLDLGAAGGASLSCTTRGRAKRSRIQSRIHNMRTPPIKGAVLGRSASYAKTIPHVKLSQPPSLDRTNVDDMIIYIEY